MGKTAPISLKTLAAEIEACRACPRLTRYLAAVAREKRKAYADQEYWARPVPGFGDPKAWLLVVGLAPGAHGANRTGRVFTGDRSGDFLYAALHRAGLASQPTSTGRDDGLALSGVYILTALRCAPPANKPETTELSRCASFLDREIELVSPSVVLALGKIGWDSFVAHASRVGEPRFAIPSPKPAFSHGAEAWLGATPLVGSYHVSQQNTFTGKLTEAMFDRVLARCAELRELAENGQPRRNRHGERGVAKRSRPT